MARFRHRQREQEAQRICLMKIRERGLAMKLARVEQVFDGSRLIFYYTAEGRVDFRELVRDLAAHFRARIEMRQIGVRDEAKMLGGYGPCGRPLCCSGRTGRQAPASANASSAVRCLETSVAVRAIPALSTPSCTPPLRAHRGRVRRAAYETDRLAPPRDRLG